jgi:pimeloyl-ACP methyl ester carboxylesterase
MQHVTSQDGTRIAYRRSGSGPPLVLVHGATADHQRWATVLPHLEPYFTLFAVDRRGRGGSGDGPEYSIWREAEDVVAVVEAEAAAAGEPIDVLAHSIGGLYTLEAALLTDGIRRLILYEPAIPPGDPPVPEAILDRMQASMDEGDPEGALEIMFREVVHMPDHEFEMYRRLPAWAARVENAPILPRELRHQAAYEFDGSRFANMTTPTLLLTGGDSPAFTREVDRLLLAALPDVRVVIMPGQQHIAMDTNPELFAEEVREFLANS